MNWHNIVMNDPIDSHVRVKELEELVAIQKEHIELLKEKLKRFTYAEEVLIYDKQALYSDKVTHGNKLG